jgi:uncharacterized membrane protein
MKYTVDITINRPIETVIDLFDSQQNMFKWMRGLQSVENICGEPGQPGAKSKMLFRIGRRTIEMVETIIAKDLPTIFCGTYEAKGVYNEVNNRFVKLSETKTKIIAEQYFEFKGMMWFLALLMPKAFKKQSYKYLTDFKNFAESV